MLTPPLAHHGSPAPGEAIWTSWNGDPLLATCLLAAGLLYVRGRRSQHSRSSAPLRPLFFALGLVTVGVALVSPLDALSGALASAHMTQHVLLIAVAAPLLALSRPVPTLLKGTPLVLRRTGARALRRVVAVAPTGLVASPTVVCLLHVAGIWGWHAAVPYDAALASEPLHALEHAAFFGTALLFWGVVVGGRRRTISYGYRLLLVFAVAMPGVVLGALMTFAPAPWYDGYAATTSRYGLDPLADQQLAGVIMWVPGGLVYAATAVVLLALWLREAELRGAAAGEPPLRARPVREAEAVGDGGGAAAAGRPSTS